MYESHKICFEEKYMGTSFVYDMIYFVLFFSIVMIVEISGCEACKGFAVE